jgi:hypothetical protein
MAVKTSSRSRPRRRLWLGGAAVLALSFAILALFAWPHGDGSGGGPLNVVAEAAAKTQKEPGGRITMRALISSGKSNSLTMRGRGVFDGAGQARMVVRMRRPDTARRVRMEAIGDGTVMYMRSNLFDPLPDGKKWMMLDLGSAMELDSPLPAGGDVKGELGLLETVGDDVRKLGKEKVRGVETTRYRGTLEPSEEAQRLREDGSSDFATDVEDEGSPLQVEAWIDGDELVRRMRIVSSHPQDEGKGEVTIDMVVDLFDFGFEPEIEVPDSNEVFDATSLATS